MRVEFFEEHGMCTCLREEGNIVHRERVHVEVGRVRPAISGYAFVELSQSPIAAVAEIRCGAHTFKNALQESVVDALVIHTLELLVDLVSVLPQHGDPLEPHLEELPAHLVDVVLDECGRLCS